jgi:ribokinase
MSDVSVVGSLHLDIMVAAPRLPALDETLPGSGWRYQCGGKGGNQAVAAARFGAKTAFGGCIGDDDFGTRILANLNDAGVDTRFVKTDAALGSGMSIAVEVTGGDYGAIIVTGANAAIEITEAWSPLWSCKALLLQNEVPEAVNLKAAKAAKAAGARVLLNAAPARAMPDELLALVDVLIVNRVEAAMLAGALDNVPGDVIVTLGGDGLELRTRHGAKQHIAAHPVTPVSSHGAGDCFCGALAARLAQGDDLEAASVFANKAAASLVAGRAFP